MASPSEAVAVISRKVETAVQEAMAFVVTTRDDYEQAAQRTLVCRALLKEIDAAFNPTIAAADHAHKIAVKSKNDKAGPVRGAMAVYDQKMVVWDSEQVQERLKEAARLQEVARRAAEDARIREAEALERKGKKEAAEALICKPVEVPVVHVEPPAEVKGISFRETWSAEVKDLAALVDHVAKDHGLLYLLEANMTAINGMARSLKANMNLPGVVAVMSRGVSKRTA